MNLLFNQIQIDVLNEIDHVVWDKVPYLFSHTRRELWFPLQSKIWDNIVEIQNDSETSIE